MSDTGRTLPTVVHVPHLLHWSIILCCSWGEMGDNQTGTETVLVPHWQYNKKNRNVKQQYTGLLLSAATMAKCIHTRKTLAWDWNVWMVIASNCHLLLSTFETAKSMLTICPLNQASSGFGVTWLKVESQGQSFSYSSEGQQWNFYIAVEDEQNSFRAKL